MAEAREDVEFEGLVPAPLGDVHGATEVLQRTHEVTEAEVGVRLAQVDVAMETDVTRLVL